MFKTINNFFSTKYDLLAIGLFTGATIALMLSELFNWFLSGFVSKAIPETSAWFAVISFSILFLKFFCIAFVLFDIDWLYNRFVRKHLTQKGIFVQQELDKPSALEQPIEDLKESKLQLKARLKTQLKKDQELQQQSQKLEVKELEVKELEAKELEVKELGKQKVFYDTEGKSKSGFIVEYLQGHDNKLSGELFAKVKVEDLNTENSSESEMIDLMTILKQDLQNSNALSRFSQSTKASKPDNLNSERIRSVLAKH